MLKIFLIVTVTWVPSGAVNSKHEQFKFAPTRGQFETRGDCITFWEEEVKPQFIASQARANSVEIPYKYEAFCVVYGGK